MRPSHQGLCLGCVSSCEACCKTDANNRKLHWLACFERGALGHLVRTLVSRSLVTAASWNMCRAYGEHRSDPVTSGSLQSAEAHWLATEQDSEAATAKARQPRQQNGRKSREQGQEQGQPYSNTTSKPNLVLGSPETRPKTRPKRGSNEVQNQPKAPVAELTGP